MRVRHKLTFTAIALSENGGEPPKRRQWRMKRGGEVKKQGESRSASSERGDYVSEGAVDCECNEQDGCGDKTGYAEHRRG